MCTYLGIRYAQAPIGDKRFGEPIPVEPLTVPTQAVLDGSLCPQIVRGIRLSINEDCLILNVYTPQNVCESDPKEQPSKSVIVYIHGGALVFGGSASLVYSPDFMVENDVVVVTMNYRLSVTGFLSLGTKECGGNMGLKDQSLALKWVRNNIQSFGGDPNRVTLMGESAGSWSAYLQTVSPKSRGLFNQVILQSPIAYSFVKNYTEDYSFKYAKHMGYAGDISDRQAVCNYLKKRNIVELLDGFGTFTDKLSQTVVTYNIDYTPFWPVVDSDLGDDSFIPDDPNELAKNVPPYPVICGQTSKEGGIYFFPLTSQNYTASLLGGPPPKPLAGTAMALDKFIDLLVLLAKLAISVENEEIVARVRDNLKAYVKLIVAKNGETVQPRAIARVRNYYFQQLGENEVSSATDLYADLAFFNFYDQLAALNASFESGNIYTYEIDYEGTFQPLKLIYYGLKDAPTVRGMVHAGDIFYNFYSVAFFPVFRPSQDDKKVISLYSTIFTNFAKTGNPNGNNTGLQEMWNPISSENRDYLLVNAAPRIVTGGINTKRHEVLASAVNSKR